MNLLICRSLIHLFGSVLVTGWVSWKLKPLLNYCWECLMSHHKSRLSRKRIRRNCTCFSKVHPRAPVKDKKVWFLHKLLKSSSLWMRFPPTKRKIFSLSFCFGKQHEIFAWNVFYANFNVKKLLTSGFVRELF